MSISDESATHLPTKRSTGLTIDRLCLLAVLIVAVLVGWTHQDATLTFDELWHLALTKGHGSPIGLFHRDVVVQQAISQTSLEEARSLLHVWTGMDGVLHPPLYVILLRIWRELFGEGDRVAQTLSLLWSLVSVTFVFLTARLSMNRPMAILCGLTIALSQTQVYFAQEVRGYAMLIGLSSIALWLMTRIELLGPSRSRAIGLALMSFPILLTHYFAFGGIMAIGVYGFLRLSPHRKVFFTLCSAMALLFFVVWVPFALRQIAFLNTGDALVSGGMGSLTMVLPNALGAPFRLLAERNFELERIPVVTGVLFVLPWFLVRRFPALLPWALWLTLGCGAVVALDLIRGTGSVALIRYLAVCSPAVPLLFAGVAWRINRKVSYVFASTAMFVGFIYLISGNIVWVDAKDYAPISQAIAKRVQPRDAIVTYEVESDVWDSDTWMLTCSHERGLFPRNIAILTQPMTREMVTALDAPRIWLISKGSAYAVEELVPGFRATEVFGGTPGVGIVLLERDAATTRSVEAD